MAPTPPARWARLIEDFVDHERAVAGLAGPTLKSRHLHLRTFAAWWDATVGDRPARDATSADVARFLVAEADRGMSGFTRRAQIVALRRFYAWLRLTGRASGDPTHGVESPKIATTEIAVYPPAHVATILAHTASLTDLPGRLRHVIVATLRYTGMRSGELRTLRLDGLDLDDASARVTGKGGRPRTVVIPAPLIPILRRYLDQIRPRLPDSPLLLVNPHPSVTTPHRGFSHEALYRHVELAGQRAGVPGRHFPHRWRHTYATELVRSGVDIAIVQRLLGHRSIASTVGYTHLAVDDLRAALTRLC